LGRRFPADAQAFLAWGYRVGDARHEIGGLLAAATPLEAEVRALLAEARVAVRKPLIPGRPWRYDVAVDPLPPILLIASAWRRLIQSAYTGSQRSLQRRGTACGAEVT